MDGIVVGVDESAHSQPALRWAAEYGQRRAIQVTALMAWNFVDQHHLAAEERFDARYSASTAIDVLESIVARTLGEHHQVACEVSEDAADHALEQAGKGAELVVVGARGMGGFEGLLLGSVSRHVLHTACAPVAVIRSDRVPGDRPVVVGVNGSASSRRALLWALDYSTREHLPLIATYVWQWPYSAAGLYGYVPDRSTLERNAQRFLRQQLATVDPAKAVGIEESTPEGRASAKLLDISTSAAMLVVGARGHGAVASAVLGSVSDQVARHATCPVVVVP